MAAQIDQVLASPRPAPAVKPAVRMLAQYVKEANFNSPNAPRSLRAGGDAPSLQIDVAIGQTKIDKGVHEVSLRVVGSATNKAGALYDFRVVYAGLFEISGFSPEQLQSVLFINCPALTFPFLRQLIGDLIRDGGFSPVWLDPIDFGGLYLQRLQKEVTGAPN